MAVDTGIGEYHRSATRRDRLNYVLIEPRHKNRDGVRADKRKEASQPDQGSDYSVKQTRFRDESWFDYWAGNWRLDYGVFCIQGVILFYRFLEPEQGQSPRLEAVKRIRSGPCDQITTPATLIPFGCRAQESLPLVQVASESKFARLLPTQTRSRLVSFTAFGVPHVLVMPS